MAANPRGRLPVEWLRGYTDDILAIFLSACQRAPTLEEADWSQIVALYDKLMAVAPTPVVALNRAIAIGELRPSLRWSPRRRGRPAQRPPFGGHRPAVSHAAS